MVDLKSNRPVAQPLLLIGANAPKSQQWTSYEGVPEQFVPSHVRLLATDPGHQLDGLLGGKRIHNWYLQHRRVATL